MSEGPDSAPERVSTGTMVTTGKTKLLGLDYNVAALLCYVPFCFVNLVCSLVFYNTEPTESRFVRWNAMQSLVMTGAGIAIGVAAMIVTGILGLIPVLGAIIGIMVTGALWLISLGFVVLNIIAMCNVWQGKTYRIKYVCDYADKFAR